MDSSKGPFQTSIGSFFKPRIMGTSTNPPPSRPHPPTNLSSNNGSRIPPTLPRSNSSSNSSVSKVDANAAHPQAVPAIPKKARIVPIEKHHIQPLKRINALLLPISYPDSFYSSIIKAPGDLNFSRAILWQDSRDTEPKVVGGIVCRIDQDEATEASAIYIQSLALLSPYRTYGLASATLSLIITSALTEPFDGFPIRSLYAHVWTDNTEGLQWYANRSFTMKEPVIQGYYRKLKPDTAWVLRRHFTPSDHSMWRGSTSSNQPQDITPDLVLPDAQDTNSKNITPLKVGGAAQSTSSIRAASYQTLRPETEWNDLPSDILRPSRATTPTAPKTSSTANTAQNATESAQGLLQVVDGEHSRSSSGSRNGPSGKKKRVYPAAAFGST